MKHPLRLLLVLLALGGRSGPGGLGEPGRRSWGLQPTNPPVPQANSTIGSSDRKPGLELGVDKPQPTCQPATPIPIVTPAFTPQPGCSSTPGNGVLEATITTHNSTTEAVFINHSNTCSYPIGLATYRRVR